MATIPMLAHHVVAGDRISFKIWEGEHEFTVTRVWTSKDPAMTAFTYRGGRISIPACTVVNCEPTTESVKRRRGTIARAELTGAERAYTSSMGNPTWRLIFEDYTVLTETNGGIGYEVGNLTRELRARKERHGGALPVVVNFTPAGRAWNVTPLDIYTARVESQGA